MLIIIFAPPTAISLGLWHATWLPQEFWTASAISRAAPTASLQVDGSIEKIRWHAQPRVLPGNPHGFVQEESDD